MQTKYQYIITPYMTHKGTVSFLKKVSDELGAELLYHNSPKFRPKFVDVYEYICRFSTKDLHNLFFAAKQRQMRRSQKGRLNKILAFLFFCRGLYQALGIYSFSKNNQILFFPTSEPYIEAFAIRMAARALPNKPCYCYYARDFVAIQADNRSYHPTNRDFKALNELLVRCNIQSTTRPAKNRSLNKVYNVGGHLVGCNTEGQSRITQNLQDSYVIFLHDFFDAPGVFGEGVFDSLVDWFEYTVRILKMNKINFLVKPHPNQMRKSRLLMLDLFEKHALHKHVIEEVPSSHILDSNPFCVVTNHGSIALEAIAHGCRFAFSGENLLTILKIEQRPRSKEAYKARLLKPSRSHFSAEIMSTFIHNINQYEFSYKYQIPLVYSRHPKFYQQMPKNDAELREICEESPFYLELLENSLAGDDFKKLITEVSG